MAKIANSQSFRIADSYLNLIVGIVVVVAIGALVIGLIRGRGGQQPEQAEPEEIVSEEVTILPAKHTVAAGEDLWKISDKYYKTGYNWVDIAKENNLVNPNAIGEGTELTIPNVTPKVVQEEQVAQAPTAVPTQPIVEPSPIPTLTPQADAISGNTYTVAPGDHLWSIALRAYGDGYKWVDIARANKLVNPNIIHRGNVLTIPR